MHADRARFGIELYAVHQRRQRAPHLRHIGGVFLVRHKQRCPAEHVLYVVMVTLLRSALIFERSAHRRALFLQRTGLNLSGGDGQDAGDTKELNGALRTMLRDDDRALKALSVGSDPVAALPLSRSSRRRFTAWRSRYELPHGAKVKQQGQHIQRPHRSETHHAKMRCSTSYYGRSVSAITVAPSHLRTYAAPR